MTEAKPSTRTVPLTCHGHSRPITHVSFSSFINNNPLSNPSNPSPPTSSTSATISPIDPPGNQSYYLISSCKDACPILRDGTTGDWLGTFIGHKGAVWSTRLSANADLAITGSADFTARIWDTHSGQCVGRITQEHVVRAVAFNDPSFVNGGLGNSRAGLKVATGGVEKKVRVWDVDRIGGDDTAPEKVVSDFVELGKGEGQGHEGTVRSLFWTKKDGVNELVTAAEDSFVRWWDLRQPDRPIAKYQVDGPMGSCELNDLHISDGYGTISVAAGKNVYLFDGGRPGELIKRAEMQNEVASAAVNSTTRKLVTGSGADTWVRVWDLDTEQELETNKGHHGPVWTIAFSPDGKIYATGSEDGTIKLWKATNGPYGLWR